jgi:hypothetical protein
MSLLYVSQRGSARSQFHALFYFLAPSFLAKKHTLFQKCKQNGGRKSSSAAVCIFHEEFTPALVPFSRSAGSFSENCVCQMPGA